MAYDYEYQRNGVSNLFVLYAPLEGWRRVEVTQRRTKVDWARVIRKLVDEDYPRPAADSAGDGQPEHATIQLPCIRPSSQPRPGASLSGWSSTTHPSMGVSSK